MCILYSTFLLCCNSGMLYSGSSYDFLIVTDPTPIVLNILEHFWNL